MFQGSRVLALESRRAVEIAELIRINDGEPFVARSLVEAPLTDNHAVFDFADRLYAGEFQMVILLTGVGTRLLHKVLCTREPAERFPNALRDIAVVARGPKPASVLREWHVPVSVTVPEPNTWREVLGAVAKRGETRVAVQEYGRSNDGLIRGLEEQGRTVTSVPVYTWKLPDDTAPLSEAIRRLLANEFAAVLFTTGVQIDHLVQFAASQHLETETAAALRKTFVASIGPDCSEALRYHGIEPDFQPSHPKMGILVREAARALADRRTPTESTDFNPDRIQQA